MSIKSTMIKARGMQLADTVSFRPFGKWHNAIVKQIDGENVTLFRPHGTTADFGVEEYTISLASDAEYELLDRKTLR